jgi:hypothetical protein
LQTSIFDLTAAGVATGEGVTTGFVVGSPERQPVKASANRRSMTAANFIERIVIH